MKKYIYFVLLVFIASCNNSTTENLTPDLNANKSKFYKEVIIKNGGDFSGFTLGQKQSEASQLIPVEFLGEKDKAYQFYSLENTYTTSEFQLYFEDNKLKELNFDTHVYDETGTFDKAGAETLFNEIKEDFLKQFGKKYMENSEQENEILFWTDDKKNIQLIHEKAKAAVHVYIDISEFE